MSQPPMPEPAGNADTPSVPLHAEGRSERTWRLFLAAKRAVAAADFDELHLLFDLAPEAGQAPGGREEGAGQGTGGAAPATGPDGSAARPGSTNLQGGPDDPARPR